MFRAEESALRAVGRIEPLLKDLITVLNSIHARQELMNEQLGKILYILAEKSQIQPKYEEITNSKGELQ